MNTKRLAQIIEKHYWCHGAHIKLKLQSIVGSDERYIFRIKLKPGTKENLIFDRASDIKTALALPLFQPFRDGLAVFLAVSKNAVLDNSLVKMLRSPLFCKSRYWLPIAIGYNMRCGMVFADLAKLPHAMYAGAPRSGKSSGLISLIFSLIVKQPVRKVNLILIDIGASSIDLFDGIPHLSYPVVKDTDTGIYVIKELVNEMERRIRLDHTELQNLPAIVCVIDEYVSFISNVDGKKCSQELANKISNLLRRGRHAKIHMILATQDPTIKNMKVDVGSITARIAFACAKYHNSIATLGEGGAEKLSEKGAMLYKSNEYPTPVYLQGAFISNGEAVRLVERIREASHDISDKFVIPKFDASEQMVVEVKDSEYVQDPNKELADIIMWVLERDTISSSQIMDRFSMGNRAYVFVKKLFEMGLVTEKFAKQPRKVLPQSIEDLPEEVLKLLLDQGFSAEKVSEIFAGKSYN